VNIEFWHIGKTSVDFVKSGVAYYQKQIGHYCTFKIVSLSSAVGKGITAIDRYKQVEADILMKKIKPGDFLVLLDEAGATLTSKKMASWLQKTIDRSPRRIIFLIGGAYGFADEVYDRSQYKLSLSPMTFPHQLVRIIFLEQLYRAFTIIHRKKYHHS